MAALIDELLDWITQNKILGGVTFFFTGAIIGYSGIHVFPIWASLGSGMITGGASVLFTGAVITLTGVIESIKKPAAANGG